jgi:hypothetical protein
MNEFELEAWTRELEAWRRRLETCASETLIALLRSLVVELDAARAVRGHGDGARDERARTRLERGFAELRAAYERLAGGESVTTPA